MNKMNPHDQLISTIAGELAPNFHQFLTENDKFVDFLHEVTTAYVETLEVFTDETVMDVAAELAMRVMVRLDD